MARFLDKILMHALWSAHCGVRLNHTDTYLIIAIGAACQSSWNYTTRTEINYTNPKWKLVDFNLYCYFCGQYTEQLRTTRCGKFFRSPNIWQAWILFVDITWKVQALSFLILQYCLLLPHLWVTVYPLPFYSALFYFIYVVFSCRKVHITT